MVIGLKNEPIIEALWKNFIYTKLKNHKYRDGIWVNKLFEKVKSNYAKSTYIHRLKKMESAGLIEVKQIKNRKYISLSPYLFSALSQLEGIHHYTINIVKTLKKVKNKSELASLVREELSFFGLNLSYIFYLNLRQLKKPFQKRMFFEVFLPALALVLDEYFSSLIKISRKLGKEYYERLEKENAQTIKKWDCYQRKEAPVGT